MLTGYRRCVHVSEQTDADVPNVCVLLQALSHVYCTVLLHVCA